jgi:hypothetical protein
MSHRCSICCHPKLDSINVSLVRDGTRFTAREFQISRPALDRHKRHLTTPIPIHVSTTDHSDADVVGRDRVTIQSLSELDVLMGHCERALIQATATKNFSCIIRAVKEIRACLELKVELEKEKQRNASSESRNQESRPLGDAELKIKMLQRICSWTKGFHPLKIWQLKMLHDEVMNLVQSKLPPDEIERQISLRTLGGYDLDLANRIFGIVSRGEWQGKEKEVGEAIVRQVRENLKGYPAILEHVDNAFAESLGKPSAVHPDLVSNHRTGESGRACLNSPYCGPV